MRSPNEAYSAKMFSLDGRTALVTGGGRGLGRGMALALASAGADVAVLSRSKEEVEGASAQIEALGRRSLALVADVGDATQAVDAIDAVQREFGRLDVLVNSAGTMIRKPVLDSSLEDWDRLMSVNLRGAFVCAQRAARHMVTQGYGRIINVASLLSVLARPRVCLYAISKGGIAQMTKAFALELAPHGVTVNAVAPGYFRTRMTEPLFADLASAREMIRRIPLGRSGVTDDLAGPVIFLSSEASSYVTGQILFVDGGWTVG